MTTANELPGNPFSPPQPYAACLQGFGIWLLITLTCWLPISCTVISVLYHGWVNGLRSEADHRLLKLNFHAERLRHNLEYVQKANLVLRKVRRETPFNGHLEPWRQALLKRFAALGFRQVLLFSFGPGSPIAAPEDPDRPSFEKLFNRWLAHDHSVMEKMVASLRTRFWEVPYSQLSLIRANHRLYQVKLPLFNLYLAKGPLDQGVSRTHYFLFFWDPDEANPLFFQSWRDELARSLPEGTELAVTAPGQKPAAMIHPKPTAQTWSAQGRLIFGFSTAQAFLGCNDGQRWILLLERLSLNNDLWTLLALLAWFSFSVAWLTGSYAYRIHGQSIWFSGLRRKFTFYLGVGVGLPLFFLLLIGHMEGTLRSVSDFNNEKARMAQYLEKVDDEIQLHIHATEKKFRHLAARLRPAKNPADALRKGFSQIEWNFGLRNLYALDAIGNFLIPLHVQIKYGYFLMALAPRQARKAFLQRFFEGGRNLEPFYLRLLMQAPEGDWRQAISSLKTAWDGPGKFAALLEEDKKLEKILSALAKQLCQRANIQAGVDAFDKGGESDQKSMLDVISVVSGIDAEDMIQEYLATVGTMRRTQTGYDFFFDLLLLLKDRFGVARNFLLLHWRQDEFALPVLLHQTRKARREGHGFYAYTAQSDWIDVGSPCPPPGVREIAMRLKKPGQMTQFFAPMADGSWHLFTLKRSNTATLTLGRSTPVGLIAAKTDSLRRARTFVLGFCLLFFLQFTYLLKNYFFKPVQDIQDVVRVLSSPREPTPRVREPIGELQELTTLFAEVMENLRELDIGKIVQDHLLPRGSQQYGHLQIGGKSMMMETVGGDFFEYYYNPARPQFAYACLGDVTGHGLPAAIVVAMASIGFKSSLDSGADDPVSILEHLNNHFTRILKKVEMMTFLILKIDVLTGEVTFSNAGQTPPLLIKPDGTSELLVLPRYPLGAKENLKYTVRQFTIPAGGFVVLYSDGSVESFMPNGKVIGYDGLQKFAVEELAKGFHGGVDRMFARLIQLTATTRWTDDVTFLVLSFSPKYAPTDATVTVD